MKYEYVLVVQFKKEYPRIWGCKNLDVLTRLLTTPAFMKDKPKFRAFTKDTAKTKGLVPDIVCSGPCKTPNKRVKK